MLKEGYPGNPQLPEATKFRIESSFKQALSLYLNGNMDDCIMGCDFILKMDPMFEPARIILEKAKNPNLEVDLSEIIQKYGPEEEINVEDLLIKSIELYNNREFQKTIDLLEKILLKDPNNNEAKEMLERAKEKLEIQAFVVQFIKRAKDYFDEGSYDDCLKEINKGLALDEINPELLELKAKLDEVRKEQEKISEVKEEIQEEKIISEEVKESGFALEEMQQPVVQEEAESSFQLEKEQISEAPPEVPFVKEEKLEQPISEIKEQPVEEASVEKFQIPPQKPLQTPAQRERIQALLDEGNRSFQLCEYQEAIDIWSRIFLIDMNNEEAAKRIEEAKIKIAEEERKIEELYNLAVSLLQQGKKDEAKKNFHEILLMEPHHIGARNYLKQLEEEQVVEEPKIKVEEKPVTLEEILPEIPKREEPVKVEPKKKKLFLPIAIAVFIIIVLAVGWLLMEGGKKGPKPLSPELLLTKAQGLISQGKLEEALAELTQIRPEAKEYPQALDMITKIKETMASKKKEVIDGRPAAVVFNEYREKAYNAYRQKDFATAEEFYKKAQDIKPLSFEDKAFYDDIQKILNQVNAAKSYVTSGSYEQAINILKPIYEEEKIIQAKELLIISNYNLGIQRLKEENLEEAYKYFKEVIKISPEDEEAQKNIKFIERYREARKDLLYQIYLKYLSSR